MCLHIKKLAAKIRCRDEKTTETRIGMEGLHIPAFHHCELCVTCIIIVLQWNAGMGNTDTLHPNSCFRYFTCKILTNFHLCCLLDVKDKAPLSFVDGMRAHKSLPQPLHLRATFVDQEQRTATIRFEQVRALHSYLHD